ncbi:MAG: type II toxin-antitoxin system PemK/MazF family toxin [Giesbergeria sp.]|nr:type II toxin-antitoxin system PemK/MazF family toxin [Giesbergeria sp.]
MPTHTTTFRPLPAPGDIVWCHFPQSLGEPGPTPRPALVVGVSPTDHAVMVVYGTSQKTDKIYPGEFVLDPNDAGFPDSGLSYRTKFNLNAQVKLPFSHEWFEKAPGFAGHIPLPKMGVLHPSYMAAVTAASQLVKGP